MFLDQLRRGMRSGANHWAQTHFLSTSVWPRTVLGLYRNQLQVSHRNGGTCITTSFILIISAPLGRYVKKWISSLQALPAELCREPWRVDCMDISQDGFWSCSACALENPLKHRSCDACRAPRPKMDCKSCETSLVYTEPMVPPPPEDLEGLCENCGRRAAGCSSEGAFYCELCWWEWLPESELMIHAPKISPSMDADSGWSSVPSQALPKQSKSQVKVQRKGGRWQVKGDRGDKLAGGWRLTSHGSNRFFLSAQDTFNQLIVS